MWYKPSNKEQQELISTFKQRLQRDGIDVNKLSNVSVLYNPKTDSFEYIVKVKNEPYTYECYFVYWNTCKADECPIYCQIQEGLTGKVSVIPAADPQNVKEQKEYATEYRKAYEALVHDLLFKKYLVRGKSHIKYFMRKMNKLLLLLSE